MNLKKTVCSRCFQSVLPGFGGTASSWRRPCAASLGLEMAEEEKAARARKPATGSEKSEVTRPTRATSWVGCWQVSGLRGPRSLRRVFGRFGRRNPQLLLQCSPAFGSFFVFLVQVSLVSNALDFDVVVRIKGGNSSSGVKTKNKDETNYSECRRREDLEPTKPRGTPQFFSLHLRLGLDHCGGALRMPVILAMTAHSSTLLLWGFIQ